MAIQLNDLYNAYQNPDQAGNVLLYGATQGRFGAPLTNVPQEDALASIAPVRPGMDQTFEPYQVATVGNTPPPPSNRAPAAVAPVAPPVQAPVDQTQAETQRLAAANAAAGPVNPADAQTRSLQQPAPAPAAAPVVEAAPDPYNLLTTIDNEKDPTKRYSGYQKMVVDPNLDEGTRKIAADNMLKALQQQQQEAKAMRDLQGMSPNDLARVIKRDTEDGSFVKYFLAKRLGLDELAGKEADKLGYTNTRSAEMLPTGEKYYVERRKDGTVVGALDPSGNYVAQDVLSRLATEAMPTKGAKAEVGVQTVVSNKTGQIGKVVTQQFGSQTRTFIESEGKMYPANGNEWKPQTEVTQLNVMRQKLMENLKYVEPTKRMEVAAKFDQENNTNFSNQLKQEMPEFFGAPPAATPDNRPAVAPSAVAPVAPSAVAPAPAPAVEAPAASALPQSPTIKVISGQRSNREQQALWDQSVAAGTPGRLPNGNPVAKPGTSLHESNNAVDIDNKSLTKQDRVALAQNGWYQPLPGKDPNHWERAQPTLPAAGGNVRPGASMAEIESARKQREREQTSALNVTEAEQKEFVQHKKTIQDANDAGRKVSQITRGQINDLMTDPVIISIMNGSGTQYAKAGKLIREMASGAYGGSPEEGKRLADDIRSLSLAQPQEDAMLRYTQRSNELAGATRVANVGTGPMSNAEQVLNRNMNMQNIGDLTPFSALTGLNRRLYSGDLSQEKSNLLNTTQYKTRAEFESAWSKIEDQRIKQYEGIYKGRLDLIKPYADAANKNPNDAVAQQRYRDAAIHSFRVYPTPEYNAQTGKWDYRTKESKRAAMNAIVGGQ